MLEGDEYTEESERDHRSRRQGRHGASHVGGFRLRGRRGLLVREHVAAVEDVGLEQGDIVAVEDGVEAGHADIDECAFKQRCFVGVEDAL